MSAPQRNTENTVFVGNLNYNTSTENFGKAFEQFGKIVSARIITGRIRGQIVSRGFGFVQFETKESTEAAIKAGTMELDGRNIRIVQSKKTERKPRLTAFLGGIVDNTTEEMIKEKFPTATMIKIHAPKDGRRGFAFVTFETEEALLAAIKDVREIQINEATVIVRIAHPQYRRRFPRRNNRRRGPRHAPKEDAPKKE